MNAPHMDMGSHWPYPGDFLKEEKKERDRPENAHAPCPIGSRLAPGTESPTQAPSCGWQESNYLSSQHDLLESAAKNWTQTLWCRAQASTRLHIHSQLSDCNKRHGDTDDNVACYAYAYFTALTAGYKLIQSIF